MDGTAQAGSWRDYVSLAIAAIALAQPWAISAWRRFVRRGRVDIFETGRIEVGYSGYGPTVSLLGTLRAKDRAFFVRSIEVSVERQTDGARHDFEWSAFRSLIVRTRAANAFDVAIPTGLMVTPQQPRPFNIFFSDVRFQRNTLNPILDRLRTAWTNAVRTALGAVPNPANPAEFGAHLQAVAARVYQTFQMSPDHVTAFTEVNQEFYWTPGPYRLTARVLSEKGNQEFPRSWRFELTAQDTEALRRNAIRIVQEACGQPFLGDYEFASVAYQPT